MSREPLFILMGVVLSYVLFFALVPAVSLLVNSQFYGGEPLYRLTWSHYVLPAAGSISTILLIAWLSREVGWPKKVDHYAILLFSVLILSYFAFVLGIQAYRYTFVLLGAGPLNPLFFLYLFLFTPFWALIPGILAGWLSAILLYGKQ